MRAFRKGAEKYASETQLIKRVEVWQDKLSPILQAEEERNIFDMQKYGSQVMERLQQKTKKDLKGHHKKGPVDFHEVTRQQPNFEVCRIFLASLSLANAGNVQPVYHGNHNQFQLELLKTDLESPMETYRAPSVVEQTTLMSS